MRRGNASRWSLVAAVLCAAALPALAMETEAAAPNPNVQLPESLGGSLTPPGPESTAPKLSRRWYGAPMVAADAGAIALGLFAMSAWAHSRSEALPLAVASGGLYLLAGPTLDAAHERTGHAVGMFFARLVLPAGLAVVGGFAGRSMADPHGDVDAINALGGLMLGAAVGTLAASLWDNLTAFEPVHEETARVWLTPFAAPPVRTGGLSLGVKF